HAAWQRFAGIHMFCEVSGMRQRDDVKGFLGTGWKFPVSVDEATGRVRMSSCEENIEESVRIILGTGRGERIMEPEFGCRLFSYAFESVNYTTMYAMKNEVENALTRWEPRITDIHAEVSDEQLDEGVLLIRISYVIRATNNPYNLVYPFYISEGIE
ncbi:MAG: GPW/gp25 family protein, partial [Lachnospiraceae bacterium]|nr:GPW/gp25 family protein [Lachnospiraceae bacterium]